MLFKKKIGVLLPQSKQFKSIDKDFIRGLKMELPEVNLFIESIGIGVNHQLVLDKIQKLHFQEDIKIIVGFFGHHNISEIYEYAANNEIILIASDLGAKLPFSQKKQDTVFINSYGIVESFFLLGKHLKEKNIKYIASSSSYYDCGYDILAALEASCNENNIHIAGHYITPFIPRENEAQIMNDNIKELNPDVVVAFHSGLYSEEHAELINNSKAIKQYPYYLSSFTFHERLTETLENINLVASWIENNEDCSFSEKYKNNYHNMPTVFSLLGYETSLILSNCLDNSFENMIQNIKCKNIEGPRGVIKFDVETNRTNYNHNIYKVQKENSKFKIFSIIENNGEFIKEILKTDLTDNSGGWQNAYLCH